MNPKTNEQSILTEVERVLKVEAQGILTCLERLKDPKRSQNLTQALELFQNSLSQGGKIVLAGVGKSGKIAQKIATTLCSTGSLAVYLHPTEGLHGDIGFVQTGDVGWILSNTGNTEEVLRLLPLFKDRGVPVIGMGGNSESKLAKSSTAWIDAAVENEACPHGLAPTTSTTLALALGDAIAITLMKLKGFDVNSFAKNHPGGGLGNRMNLEVKDLMHSNKELPLLGPKASMEEVVVVSTEKKLGAVLIVENIGENIGEDIGENVGESQGKHPRLLGIITDGDLRRALQKKEKFFGMRADEVMTSQPITIQPHCKAREALRLMEDRPSQIHVLPVVNETQGCLGLLRLHDLLRSI